jgi:hypothetical protein
MFVCGEVRLFPLAPIRVWTICLIANLQEMFPLPEIPLKAHAFGNLE